MHVGGVLLDIDGVLALSWRQIDGAADTLGWLRSRNLPFRLITNTTTHTRRALVDTLAATGIDVRPDEIVTAVVATVTSLRAHHRGARVFLLSDGETRADLEGIELVDVADADVIVVGGACADFSYATLNRVFQRVMEGAILVGMHRNLYWRTEEGWQLDGGAYIAGLEEATGRKAIICGKPSRAFFETALAMLGTSAAETVMVGDDVVTDVLGAQEMGMTGVLVRTGKFRPGDLGAAAGEPGYIVDSVADLPGLLESLDG